MMFWVFIYFIAFCMLMNGFLDFRSGHRLTAISHGVALLVLTGGIQWGISNTMEGGRLSSANYAVIAVALFAIYLLVFHTLKLRAMIRGSDAQKASRSFQFGSGIWAIILGIYLLGAVVDHLLFFRTPNAGTINAALLGVKDVQCNQIALFRIDGDTIIYRCPETLVLGGLTTHPFAPWPHYYQGRSTSLKVALDEFSRTNKLPAESLRP